MSIYENLKVSVAIAAYEMNGKGVECLEFSFEKIKEQLFSNVEVIVSDHSYDDEIEKLCKRWANYLDIKYCYFPTHRGSSSANQNNALRHCTGDIIKVLCQDDYLLDENSLLKIVETFANSSARWLVSSYLHTKDRVTLFRRQDPRMNAEIHYKNTIGTHSCLSIKNVSIPYFDERLIWYMDCEYYRQLYNLFGAPATLREITMVQYLWEGQVSNTIVDKDVQDKELALVRSKYPCKISNLSTIEGDRWMKRKFRKMKKIKRILSNENTAN